MGYFARNVTWLCLSLQRPGTDCSGNRNHYGTRGRSCRGIIFQHCRPADVFNRLSAYVGLVSRKPVQKLRLPSACSTDYVSAEAAAKLYMICSNCFANGPTVVSSKPGKRRCRESPHCWGSSTRCEGTFAKRQGTYIASICLSPDLTGVILQHLLRTQLLWASLV